MKPQIRLNPLAAVLLLLPHLANSQTAPALTASPASLTFSFPQGGSLPTQQSLVIAAADYSQVNFTLTSSTASGGNWLSVAPLQGTTPATLIVQLNAFSSGLSAGSYAGTITVTGGSQPLKIPVTLNVGTTLSVSASTLTLSAQQGASPSSQTVNVTAGSAIPYTATTSSAGSWLSVKQSSATTPGTLTISADPTGLAPGTYSGSVSVASPAAATVTIAVTFTVTATPVLTFAPASLSFQSTSAVPQPPPQTVSVFSNVPTPVVATATIAAGGPWLTVMQSATQTPAVLTVSVNPANLNPGTYTAQVEIAPGNTQSPTPLAVTFTVVAPQPPTLQAAPDTISLSSSQGGLPVQTGLSISNVGGGTINFTAQSSAPWLSLGLTAGTVTAGTSMVLPVTVTPGTLAPATYSAPVTITAGSQTATSLIVLSISPQGPSLLLSQTGLLFNAVAQAPNPPAQMISAVNTGAGSLPWTVTTSTLSGGSNWLSATPGSGTTQPLPATPPAIAVSVNSQNLAPGTYYGSVNVSSQVVSVQTTVLPAGKQLAPSLSTNGLVFTSVAGSNPNPQSISIFNLNQSTWPSVTTSTDDGGGWLFVTVPNGVPSGPSVAISVQAALTGQTSGIRHGTLRFAFADGSVQTVGVLWVVAPAGTSPQSVSNLFLPAAGGSCPSQLVPQITSPALNFSVLAAQSVPLTVTVVDDCGHALPNSSSSSVIASFYDASNPPGSGKLRPDMRLSPQGNGVWAGTWTPQAGISQIEVIIVALGILGTTPIAGQTEYTGSVQNAAPNAPALPAGIFNAASFQPGNVVALGSFVSIFGSSLADGSNAPSTQPLPTQVGGTQVFLGGVALPLQFAGPNQINALIPANVTINSQQPLQVQRDSTQAAPTAVTIADSQPGIYTANQQGTGQGAVLTSDNVLDAPIGSYPGAHPAARGGVIQVFCTGLGAVTNPPAAGAAAPNSPLSTTVSQVTANIGGINAPVIFSGLAPGFIGLYQVNVTVPMSAPVGDAVPLTLTVGSSTSNTATIAIQ